jgi:hypothetical protein
VLAALLATEPEHRPTAAHARDMLNAVAHGFEPNVPLPPEAATMLVGQDAGESPTMLVGDADRTRMVGPRRTGTGIRPVPRQQQRQSRAPLAIGVLVLAVVIGVGAWLLVNRQGADNGNTHTTGNDTGSTTVIQAPEQTLPPTTLETTETQTRSRTSSKATTTEPTTELPPFTTTTTTTTQTTQKPPSSTAPSSQQGG